ncbi:hypothetical protein [Rubrolithibacter danxiaensis]|uniref:hypothetical protein n=1 Tax=Rubrolithibacter danxiaensis TaxID=3390805 RepID=UPI003BF7A4DB
MTVKTQDEEVQLAQNLKARNKEVEKSYHQITQAVKPLLTVFESKKYRTCIEVNHAKSGKDTNLDQEFICFFWNLTLATNKAGYKMLYFTYDEDALAKFGARMYNKALRQLYKHTMFEATKLNIEDSVRLNNPANVQSFFINRLANGENDFISISIEEKVN